MRFAALVIVLTSVACLRTTQFHCDTSDQCGAGGTCESGVGFCSFADSQCSDGRRFGPQAGDYANQCVGGGTGSDANNGSDGGGDANHCPSGYVTVPNATHRYKLVLGANDWQSQRDGCSATSPFAYLAIPDDQTELDALDAFVSAQASAYWIGVDDLTTPDAYVTVKSAAQSFLPWDTGQPDNGPPPKDCVEVLAAKGKFADDKCSTNVPALCECE